MDEYVGVMLQAIETHLCQTVLQACCVVLAVAIAIRQVRQGTAIRYSLFLSTSHIGYTTHLATAIYLIDCGSFIQVYLGIVSPCIKTIACTIYCCLVTLSSVRPCSL